MSPMPLAACSNASVWGSSLSEIAGSNPVMDKDDLSLVSVVYCHVEVSA